MKVSDVKVMWVAFCVLAVIQSAFWMLGQQTVYLKPIIIVEFVWPWL